MRKMIDEATSASKQDKQDAEKCKNNIIIYRVPESDGDSVDVRKVADKKFAQDLFCEGLRLAVDSNEVTKVYRLGKTNLNRPMLVKFASKDTKDKVMFNKEPQRSRG